MLSFPFMLVLFSTSDGAWSAEARGSTATHERWFDPCPEQIPYPSVFGKLIPNWSGRTALSREDEAGCGKSDASLLLMRVTLQTNTHSNASTIQVFLLFQSSDVIFITVVFRNIMSLSNRVERRWGMTVDPTQCSKHHVVIDNQE